MSTEPRDLRFNKIVSFKEKLADKIQKTFEKSQEDSSYSTFLKHFGDFTAPKINVTEIPQYEYILEEIKALNRRFDYLEREKVQNTKNGNWRLSDLLGEREEASDKIKQISISLGALNDSDYDRVRRIIADFPSVRHAKFIKGERGIYLRALTSDPELNSNILRKKIFDSLR